MRVPIQGVYLDGRGGIVVSGNVKFYEYNDSDPDSPTTIATIYEDRTGGSAVATGIITTDTNGAYIAWIEATDYISSSLFTLVLSKSTHTEVPWHVTVPGLAGVIRAVNLALEPGATPGTNINVTQRSSIYGSNVPTITDGTDIAAGGSSGSFSLDGPTASILTMDITENVIGVLSATISGHDLNSSSTTEMYFPWIWYVSGNLNISLAKRAVAFPPGINLLTILNAGDECNILIAFVTDS